MSAYIGNPVNRQKLHRKVGDTVRVETRKPMTELASNAWGKKRDSRKIVRAKILEVYPDFALVRYQSGAAYRRECFFWEEFKGNLK